VTTTSMLLQTLVPLGLLAWLVVFPAPGGWGYLGQAVGVGFLISGAARVGLWIMPPWWMPWLLGGAWGVAVLARLTGPRRREPSDRAPSRSRGRANAVASLLLAGVGAWATWTAVSARKAPSVEVVDIPNPLGPGRYLVAHGGSRALVNGHMKTLDPAVERFRAWRGQSYAVDLVGLDRWGLHANGVRPVDPARYVIFGGPVFAPCAGEVTGTENALPDMPVPEMDREHLLGNHVLLRCGDAVLVFAHLREGSVVVAPGEVVEGGTRLGEVGNSGNSSEPHLHLHAQRAGSADVPIGGEPLGLRIEGRFVVRNDRIGGRAW
jgi:murein DD-endopeptidase MepM/ murein hydrolase activator NlpD